MLSWPVGENLLCGHGVGLGTNLFLGSVGENFLPRHGAGWAQTNFYGRSGKTSSPATVHIGHKLAFMAARGKLPPRPQCTLGTRKPFTCSPSKTETAPFLCCGSAAKQGGTAALLLLSSRHRTSGVLLRDPVPVRLFYRA